MPDFPSEPRFTITLDGSWMLDVRDVWPDGDAPDNPTPFDVLEAMRETGALLTVIREWNLHPDMVISSSDGARSVMWDA